MKNLMMVLIGLMMLGCDYKPIPCSPSLSKVHTTLKQKLHNGTKRIFKGVYRIERGLDRIAQEAIDEVERENR
jgi:hypothetical protein